MNLENIPTYLKEYAPWCDWKKEKRKSGITKVPYNPKTGKHAYVDNPDTFLISNPQYLQWLLYTYMKRKTPKKSSAELQKYRESYLTDDGVLAKAMASKQGEKFRKL